MASMARGEVQAARCTVLSVALTTQRRADRRNDPDRLAARETYRFCGMNRLTEPTVAKSEHALIGWHYIQEASADDPTTDRRLRTAIVAEASLLEFTFESVVVGERQDFDNHVHVLRCPHWGGSNVCHQQSSRAAADEHESFAQCTEGSRDRLEER